MVRQGLPREIIKKYGISKKAWSVFRSGLKPKRTTNTKVIRVKPHRTSPRVTVMKRVRRRFSRPGFRRFRRRTSHKMPILPIIGLAPPAFNFMNWVKDPLMSGNIQGAAYNGAYSLLKDFAGYDLNEGKWTGGNMLSTYGALFAGYIGHKLASKFGVNRAIARIPMLGKWVEL